MGTASSSEEHGDDRAARIARVVEDVSRRRASGEQVDVADVIDQHPALMPELAERLSVLGLIEKAVRLAVEGETDTVGMELSIKGEPLRPQRP